MADTPAKQKNTGYKFTLKNIHVDDIYAKFKIVTGKQISNNDELTPITHIIGQPPTTKLSDLHSETTRHTISFLDESRKNIKCNIVTIYPDSDTKYNCFWDRNPFSNDPLGCPIKYVYPSTTKRVVSEINKNGYMIRQSYISSLYSAKDDSVVESNSYYETDGNFCSFNCIQAFITDNIHNKLYENSKHLLLKMYRDISNKEIKEIKPAPHWRLLEEYGGPLSIEKFRDSFNFAEYEYQGNIHNIPKFSPVGMLFNKKIMF
jgi:hypothetical protein